MRYVEAQRSARERDQGRRAAAAADQHDGRAVEFVVGDQFVDRAAQGRRRALEDRARHIATAQAERFADARAGVERRFAVAARERAFGHEPQRVRSARRRQRDARLAAASAAMPPSSTTRARAIVAASQNAA